MRIFRVRILKAVYFFKFKTRLTLASNEKYYRLSVAARLEFGPNLRLPIVLSAYFLKHSPLVEDKFIIFQKVLRTFVAHRQIVEGPRILLSATLFAFLDKS